MNPRLAFMTVGVLDHRPGDEAVQEFFDSVLDVYAAAERSPGFLDRWDPSLDPALHAWGAVQLPRCYAALGLTISSQTPSTLSLWTDLESMKAYAHQGLHARALAKRRDWFRVTGLPTHVAFWVGPEQTPTWAEPAERLDHLHESGATAFAFDLKTRFDARGHAALEDRARWHR